MINNEISNMKIVHILNSLKGGGIQNFLLSLAPEQVIKGCQVLIIVVDNDDYEYCIRLKEKFENIGVRVCYLNKKLHSKISFLKTLIKCRNIIKKEQPDIVNTHGEICHIYGAVATWGRKIKHCITVHNAPEHWNKLNILFNGSKPLIFCSEAAYSLRVQKNKSYEVINNGISPSIVQTKECVNLRDELNLSHNDKIVVSVGSLRPQKNYDFLKEISTAMMDEHIHFCVCGGNYGKGYINTNSFKEYKNIHFLGLRSDISAIENTANLFLSCATFEGLPIAVLEAYFNGIPCVLSPIEQHINISNVSKCWIPESFKVSDFIVAIKEALRCEDSHNIIYAERLPFIEIYSISRTAELYIKYYNNLL